MTAPPAPAAGQDEPGQDEPYVDAYPVHRRIATRWADNDDYGHVNNVVYYEWFDTAVNGWLIDATGCDIRRLPAVGVVAESSCRYLHEISFPQIVTVGLRLERRGRSSVVYRLAVFGEIGGEPEGPVCAFGRFVHVYVDADTRRPVQIPDEIARALDTLTRPGAAPRRVHPESSRGDR